MREAMKQKEWVLLCGACAVIMGIVLAIGIPLGKAISRVLK